MALRPFGYSVQNPIAGSEWIGQQMERAGLVSQARDPTKEFIASMAVPIGVAAAPKAIQATGQAARALAPKAGEMAEAYMQRSGLAPQLTAYHGTPHRFAPEEGAPLGRFRSEKIGTGEGAQAYGHGLYLAEAPGTARTYMTAGQSVVPKEVKYGGRDADQWYAHFSNAVDRNPRDETAKAAMYFWERIASRQHPQAAINAAIDEGADWPELLKYAQSLDIKKFKGVPPSYLYTVDLPDTAIAKMLDWDKPLTKQSQEVRQKLKTIVDSELGKGTWAAWSKNDPDYRDLVNDLFETKSAAEISELLRKSGIPGIRYLDAGSRGQGGKATSNFVVFPGEENILKILERQ
jgi:hypothetical protein